MITARRFFLIPAALLLSGVAQAQLQITAPANNAVYAPGATVSVTVSVTAGSNITQVAIATPDPIPWTPMVTAPPYNFSIILPSSLPIGSYDLYAAGNSGPGTGILAVSAPVTIIVDKSVAPTSIAFEPSSATLSYLGATRQLFVRGKFADGSNPTLNGSPQLAVTSATPGVATVDNNGIVTAVTAGTATINATYQKVTASAIVTVTAGPAPVTCTFGLQAGQSSFPSGGGKSSVTITASDPSCSWSATPGASWIALTPPAFASGNGSVAFTVAANTVRTARNSSLLIAGQLVALNQAASTAPANPCDVDNDGTVTVADVQRIINETLGSGGGGDDVNQDGWINVVDIQRVANATLGMPCM